MEIRIDYKYPKYYINCSSVNFGAYYYRKYYCYEESHYGIRGVYTLGNSYFVIDHLPESDLPSTAKLATSWNMPRNTTQLGTSGWQQFVFEGTTPDSANRSGLMPQSRIELAVVGATNF